MGPTLISADQHWALWAVLLGSAILGATAAGAFNSVLDAMAAMNQAGEVIEPTGGAEKAFHDAKQAVFLRMYDDFLAQRALMEQV